MKIMDRNIVWTEIQKEHTFNGLLQCLNGGVSRTRIVKITSACKICQNTNNIKGKSSIFHINNIYSFQAPTMFHNCQYYIYISLSVPSMLSCCLLYIVLFLFFFQTSLSMLKYSAASLKSFRLDGIITAGRYFNSSLLENHFPQIYNCHRITHAFVAGNFIPPKFSSMTEKKNVEFIQCLRN